MDAKQKTIRSDSNWTHMNIKMWFPSKWTESENLHKKLGKLPSVQMDGTRDNKITFDKCVKPGSNCVHMDAYENIMKYESRSSCVQMDARSTDHGSDSVVSKWTHR